LPFVFMPGPSFFSCSAPTKHPGWWLPFESFLVTFTCRDAPLPSGDGLPCFDSALLFFACRTVPPEDPKELDPRGINSFFYLQARSDELRLPFLSFPCLFNRHCFIWWLRSIFSCGSFSAAPSGSRVKAASDVQGAFLLSQLTPSKVSYSRPGLRHFFHSYLFSSCNYAWPFQAPFLFFFFC